VTGAAVPVSWAAPGSDDWLAARRLGASDWAVAQGLSQYKTPTRLWLEKTGQVEPEDAGEAAEWGHRLEPVLVARFAEGRDGFIDVAPTDMPSVVAHPDHPALTVSLDAVWHNPTESAVVEAKTAGIRQAKHWDDGGIPQTYLAQTLYQLAVTGLDVAYVPVLIGGQRYEERVVRRNEAYCRDAVEEAARWWDTHVVAGVPPDDDPRALVLPWPDVEPDSTIVIGSDVIDRYRAARAAHDQAAADYDAAAALLRDAIGDATHAVDRHGRLVATCKPSKPRESVSVKRVRELVPDLADELITVGKPSRPLLWKAEEE
jgi:putative phage-type endonuclease